MNTKPCIIKEIKKAIDNEDFTLVYQPQVDLSKQKIVGVEALLRWIHPTKGAISPRQYIPYLESSHLIFALEPWLFDTVFKDAKKANTHSTNPLTFSLNISPLQFTQKNFQNTINHHIHHHDLLPTTIQLEMTENLVLEKTPETLLKIQAFHAQGIALGIDDFGTGYSSLSYLKDMPFKFLKIDRMFLTDVTTSVTAQKVIETIIKLGHALDMTVIAEGVETKAQYELLASLSCDIIQGYYFYRPIPISALISII
jgi:EAL domain-containing protein (putative c-di-GMP-specific phosphodiesterase class I)